MLENDFIILLASVGPLVSGLMTLLMWVKLMGFRVPSEPAPVRSFSDKI